jgi:hypothetical protein
LSFDTNLLDVHMQVPPPSPAVVELLQNVSDAAPDVNVQHLLLLPSLVQSELWWHSWTFWVALHDCAMLVLQLFAVAQDAPTEVAPQVGNVPWPLPTSTPQHTGEEPLQSSGPSQVT